MVSPKMCCFYWATLYIGYQFCQPICEGRQYSNEGEITQKAAHNFLDFTI